MQLWVRKEAASARQLAVCISKQGARNKCKQDLLETPKLSNLTVTVKISILLNTLACP